MKKLSKMNKKKKIISIVLLVIMVLGVSYALFTVGFSRQFTSLASKSKGKIELLTPIKGLSISKESKYNAKNHPRNKSVDVGDYSIDYANNDLIVKLSGTRSVGSYFYYDFYLSTSFDSSVAKRVHHSIYLIDPETGNERCVWSDEKNYGEYSAIKYYDYVDAGTGDFEYYFRYTIWIDEKTDKYSSFYAGTTTTTFNFYSNVYSAQSYTSWSGYKPTFTDNQNLTTAKEIIFVPYEQYNTDSSNKRIPMTIFTSLKLRSGSSLSAYLYYYKNNPDTIYIAPNTSHAFISLTGDLSGFFKDFENVERIDFGNTAIISEVSTMKSMFENCYNLKYVDLSNSDFTKAKDLSRMFYGCSSLKYVILPTSINTRIINIDSMFEGCSSLTSIFVKQFDLSNVPGVDVFKGCTSLVGNNFQTSFDPNHTDNTYANSSHYFNEIKTNDDGEFYSIGNTISVPGSAYNTELSKWLTTAQFDNIKDIYFVRMTEEELSNQFSTNSNTISSNLKMKLTGPNNKILVVASTGTILFQRKMDYMFYSQNIENIYFDNISTKETTSMMNTFSRTKVSYLDLTKFDFSHVTNMEQFLYSCENLISLKFGQQDFSNVTDMGYMFGECTSLLFLDLSSLDTKSLIYANNMFYNCNKLAYIFGMRLDTSKVSNFKSMFNGTDNLYFYDFIDWDFSNAKTMKNFIVRNSTSPNNFLFEFEGADFRNVTDCTSLNDFFNINFEKCTIFKMKNIKFSNSVTSFFTPYVTVDGEDNYVFSTSLQFFEMDGISLPGLTEFSNISYDSSIKTFTLKNIDLSNVTRFVNIVSNCAQTNSVSTTQVFEISNINIPNATEIGNIASGKFYSAYMDIGLKMNGQWTLTEKLVNQTYILTTTSSSYTVGIFHLSDIDFSKCISLPDGLEGNNITDFINITIGGTSGNCYRYFPEYNEYSVSTTVSNSSFQEMNFGTASFKNVNFGNIDRIVFAELIKGSTSYSINYLIDGCDLPNVELISRNYSDSSHYINTTNISVKYFSLTNCNAPKLRTITKFDGNLISFEITGLNAPLLVGANETDGFNTFFTYNKLINLDFSYARLDSVEQFSKVFYVTSTTSSYLPRLNFEGVYFKSLKNAEYMFGVGDDTYLDGSNPNYSTKTTQLHYVEYMNFKNAHFEGQDFSMRGAFAKIAMGGSYLKFMSFENVYIKGVNNLDYAFYNIGKGNYTQKAYTLDLNMNNFTAIGNYSMDYFIDNTAFTKILLNNAKFTGVTSAKFAFAFNYNVSGVDNSELDMYNFTMKGDNFDASYLFGVTSNWLRTIYLDKLNITGANSLIDIFYGCKIATPLNLSFLDYDSLKSLDGLLEGVKVQKYIIIENIKFPKKLDNFLKSASFTNLYINDDYTNYTYEDGSIYINGCDFSNVESMSGMISTILNVDTINNIEIDIEDTSLTNISHMFSGNSSTTMREINHLDIINLDCEDVIDMSYVFAYTDVPSLSTEGMGNIDKVEDLSYAFYNSTAVSISAANITGENVRNLKGFMWSTYDLIYLDLSSFDPRPGANIEKIFNCNYSKLGYLDVSSMSAEDFITYKLGIKNFAILTTVADGAYASARPFYVVKDANTKSELLAATSYTYLTSDQLLLPGVMSIISPGPCSFAYLSSDEKAVTFKLIGKDATFENRTITAYEVNPDTSTIHVGSVDIDYGAHEIRFYVDMSNVTEPTDKTLQLSINSTTYNIPVSAILKYCTFTVAKNVGAGSGFVLDADGFYTSTNHTHYSYNLMTINYSCANTSKIIVDYSINSERNYDIGFIGLGGKLISSYTSDSSSNYLFRTYGLASSNGVLYTGRYSYNLSSQVGSLDFKYIKDGSGSYGTDDFKFKLSYE